MGATTWFSRAVWLMLAVSACWIIFLFASSYAGCRADGTGKLGCFILALFVSLFEALFFVITTVLKILTTILP